MLNVAIIGFGGISKGCHLPAYLKLQEKGLIKLVAVADVNPEAFTKAVELNIGSATLKLGEDVHTYLDWEEMLDKEDVDMVDVCVPTYLHAPVAMGALKKGCHVISEKPMALSYETCCEMVKTAKECGKKFMIAQCLRFGADYKYLKQLVEEGTFGAVKTGYFHRLSVPPVWGWENWFMDYSKSGGCITDLHIHDIDICRFIFGDPKAVSCNTQDVYCGRDVAHTVLHYDGFTTLVRGDWTQEKLPFTAEYRVGFEKATVDLKGGKVTVYPRGGGEPFEPELPGDNNFYYNEIEYFVNSVMNDTPIEGNTPEGTANTIKLIETMIESADKGGIVVPFEAK